MLQAGATFRSILASLTTTPAQRFDGEPTPAKSPPEDRPTWSFSMEIHQ